MTSERRPPHPKVLEGRNPWWRQAWSELGEADRRAVRLAYKYGARVPDDRLLPFIYGLMAMERRQLRWLWLPIMIIEVWAGLWVYVHCFHLPSNFCWLFAPLAIAPIPAAVVRIILGRRRLQRADAANLHGR